MLPIDCLSEFKLQACGAMYMKERLNKPCEVRHFPQKEIKGKYKKFVRFFVFFWRQQ